MGKQIILTGVTLPDTLPVLLPNPPRTNLVFGIDPDRLDLANGALVDSIEDFSGHHPAATQATGSKRPTMVRNALGTGRNGLHFDGTDDSLSLSGSALNIARNKPAISVFALIQRDGTTAAVRDVFSLANNSGGVRLAFGAGSGAASQLRAGTRRLDGDTSTFTTRTDSHLSDQPVKLGAFYNWGAGTLGLDAEASGYSSIGTTVAIASSGSTSDTASSGGNIGSTGTTQYFAGTLLSLLVYEAPRSTPLVDAVHAFWADRYGL